jgi:hypothetical protein
LQRSIETLFLIKTETASVSNLAASSPLASFQGIKKYIFVAKIIIKILTYTINNKKKLYLTQIAGYIPIIYRSIRP